MNMDLKDILVWVGLWVVGPLGLLFANAFFQEVILRCLHVLPTF